MTETRRRFILYSNFVLASLVRGITWQVASIYTHTQQNRPKLRQVEFSSSSRFFLSRARANTSHNVFSINSSLRNPLDFIFAFFSRCNLSKNNTNPSCYDVTHWRASEKSPFNGLCCELCASDARKKTNLKNCIRINHDILSFQTSFLFIFFINMSFSHFLMS